MDYIPQIIGFIGLVLLVSSLQSNKKGVILFLQIFANLFYGLQYILLNSLSGGMMSLISLIRCVVFYYYDKKGRKDIPETSCYILIVECIVIGIFTYTNIFSVVALVAQLVGTLAMWSRNGKTIRVLQLFCVSPLWLVHNIFVFSIGGIICEVFNLCSIIVSLIRFGTSGFEKE